MMIKYLIEKEFKQLVRNSFLPRMILGFPLMVMVLMPWAANMEIKNINLTVVDNDQSTYSRRLIQKASAGDYFRLTTLASTFDEAMHSIEKGTADIILEIPAHFERDLIRDGVTKVMISANTVNGTKGSLGSSYLSAIVADFAGEIRAEWVQGGGSAYPVIRLGTQNLFNPHMNYKVFMVPALMVMLLTMICGFLPALNIVGEKEAGTIEQINVSPVGKFTFIMAKLIPYWVVGLLILTLCFGLAALFYGITPVGSLGTLYFFAAIFILVVSGLGLVISNYSDTIQQAMFLMLFFMIVFILMSGLFTPINSMPRWAQNMAIFNPLKYFIETMRMVYLKGSGVADLGRQFVGLSLFALFFNGWAILGYRKRS